MSITSPSVTRPTSMQWMKLSLNTRTDAVVQLLSFDDQRHLIWLMMMEMQGILDDDYATDAIRDQVVAKALGLTVESALEVRVRLSELRLIDALWKTCVKAVDTKNGDASQVSHDASHVTLGQRHTTSAVRTREYRARQKAAKLKALGASGGHGDDAVTSQAVTSDALELEKEQELNNPPTTKQPKSVDKSEKPPTLPNGITREQADIIVAMFTDEGYVIKAIESPRNLRLFAEWVQMGVTRAQVRESIQRMHQKLAGVHSKPVTYVDSELRSLHPLPQKTASASA